MPLEKLFLSETLVTSVTLKGFLICVNQHVGFQMPVLEKRGLIKIKALYLKNLAQGSLSEPPFKGITGFRLQ